MTLAVEGCKAKFDRARETLAYLDGEIQKFATDTVVSVTGELDEARRNYIFKARGEPTPPLRFAVLAGEVIHQLRCSLDHMVSALVLSAGGVPSRDHNFPITSSEENFKQAIKRRALAGIDAKTIEVIKAQQPYNYPDPETHPLSVLREFDDRDKHRLLLVISAAAVIADTIVVGAPGDTPGTVIEWFLPSHIPVALSPSGVEICRFGFADPVDKFTAEAKAVIHVVFGESGPLKGFAVAHVLSQLVEATGQRLHELEKFVKA